METKFNFNSSVCTSIEQSRKLLALGLKKETADCRQRLYTDARGLSRYFADARPPAWEEDIPAWSLDRIRELFKKSQVTLSFFEDGDYVVVERYGVFQNILDQRVDMWDNLCDAFLYLITEGYFNKEYLV